MIAGQDEARAREIASHFVMKEAGDDRAILVRLIASALSEARDQGARAMRSEFDATAFALGEEIKALRDDATPSPALAPLREAELEHLLHRVNDKLCHGMWHDKAGLDARLTSPGLCHDIKAALSSAQGSTTEGRK